MLTKKRATDLNLFSFIYKEYYDEFCRYDSDDSIRASKIYVPIDCYKIAEHFGVNADIIFGRLYYHLANKYKYQHSDNVTVRIFEFEVGGDPKCIHFPYLASVVAELQYQEQKFKKTLWASIIAVLISVASFSITVYDKLTEQHAKAIVQVEKKI